MEKFKGTEGDFSFEQDGNSAFIINSTEREEVACVWIENDNEEEAKANAELIIDAFNKKNKVKTEFKGTKGEFSFSPQKGIKGHCFIAQVWSSLQENAVVNVESTNSEEEANANAELITDAFNVIGIYGLCPSELFEKYNELARMLVKARTTISRLKNSMRAHPDCTENSEFDGYVELAEQQEYEIELLINEIIK